MGGGGVLDLAMSSLHGFERLLVGGVRLGALRNLAVVLLEQVVDVLLSGGERLVGVLELERATGSDWQVDAERLERAKVAGESAVDEVRCVSERDVLEPSKVGGDAEVLDGGPGALRRHHAGSDGVVRVVSSEAESGHLGLSRTDWPLPLLHRLAGCLDSCIERGLRRVVGVGQVDRRKGDGTDRRCACAGCHS